MNIMGDKIKKHQQAEHALEQKLKSQHVSFIDYSKSAVTFIFTFNLETIACKV